MIIFMIEKKTSNGAGRRFASVWNSKRKMKKNISNQKRSVRTKITIRPNTPVRRTGRSENSHCGFYQKKHETYI